MAILLGVAIAGPILVSFDPEAWRLVEFDAHGVLRIAPSPPDSVHLLGTDALGRDMLSRIVAGARFSLIAVSVAVCMRMLIASVLAWGISLPGLAGVLVHIASAGGAGIPRLPLAIVLVVVLSQWDLLGFVVALGLAGSLPLSLSLSRQLERIARLPHVEAARALGARRSRVWWSHVLRLMLGQLGALGALEAANLLVLLAELGFIGFFIGGGTISVDDNGRPILPVRDQLPEWGQMLAGAPYYQFSHQWVAFVPAVVVGFTALVFTVLAEGIRQGLDPWSPGRLSPGGQRVLNLVLTMALGVTAAAGAFVFVTSQPLTAMSGLEKARQLAVGAGATRSLVAVVATYSSEMHGISRPGKLNYYFHQTTGKGVVRVGFAGADSHAAEVRINDYEDELPPDLQTFTEIGGDVDGAIELAEQHGGAALRRESAWTMRVYVEQHRGLDHPLARLVYGAPRATSPHRVYVLDPAVPAFALPLGVYQRDAVSHAAGMSGHAGLVAVDANWVGGKSPTAPSVIPSYPPSLTYWFATPDGSAFGWTYDTSKGIDGVVVSGLRVGNRALGTAVWPIGDLFQRAEREGGAQVHQEWLSSGATRWFAQARLTCTASGLLLSVGYTAPEIGGQSEIRIQVTTEGECP